jgi:hypothetical protein
MTEPGAARPRITFGVIVLNGEPFTRYTLRSLYPFAHEIIVVEGRRRGVNIATPDGHSRDGTLEVLRRFQAEEDPDRQGHDRDGRRRRPPRRVLARREGRAEPAYASRATGDYLWQVDIDEFYLARTWRRSSPCSPPTPPSTR